jgi:hypothetical protein
MVLWRFPRSAARALCPPNRRMTRSAAFIEHLRAVTLPKFSLTENREGVKIPQRVKKRRGAKKRGEV